MNAEILRNVGIIITAYAVITILILTVAWRPHPATRTCVAHGGGAAQVYRCPDRYPYRP